jgi:uncharacterized alkaline shock family protein YloU
MPDEPSNPGKITISPRAIATIASQGALQSYGVVGMANKSVIDGIANTLTHDPRHGVEVKVIEDSLIIDVFIIIEYGTRISSVATSVANSVSYKLEQSLGMPVRALNVHVQDLRISDPD